MNKQIGIAVGAVIILLIGGYIAFTQFSKPKVSSDDGQATSEKTASTSDALQKGTLKSLIAGGKSVTCEIVYTNGEGKGTMYVSGQKYRGDFDVKMSGASEVKSHMISDGSFTYIWSDGNAQGTKFKVESVEQAAGSPAPQQQGDNLDQEVESKCSAWSVDSSKFAVPGGVTFTDMSALLKTQTSNPKTSTEKSSGGSSYCDQITDPQAKAACLSATGGN